MGRKPQPDFIFLLLQENTGRHRQNGPVEIRISGGVKLSTQASANLCEAISGSYPQVFLRPHAGRSGSME